MTRFLVATVILLTGVPACADGTNRPSPESVYALYRSSVPVAPGDVEMRVHTATFDSIYGEKYNRENCVIAKDLFQDQPDITVRYWCERGYFLKTQNDLLHQSRIVT